jgi:hypothetical protein
MVGFDHASPIHGGIKVTKHLSPNEMTISLKKGQIAASGKDRKYYIYLFWCKRKNNYVFIIAD